MTCFPRMPLRHALWALVVVGLVGCKPQVKLVPATGTFTIGGKPAGNITLQFMPDTMQGNAGPTSYATTDAEGKFTLRTYDNRDGAVPGAHVVTLVDLDEERPAQGSAPTRAPRLDAKYSMAASAPRVTVAEGQSLSIDVPPPGR